MDLPLFGSGLWAFEGESSSCQWDKTTRSRFSMGDSLRRDQHAVSGPSCPCNICVAAVRVLTSSWGLETLKTQLLQSTLKRKSSQVNKITVWCNLKQYWTALFLQASNKATDTCGYLQKLWHVRADLLLFFVPWINLSSLHLLGQILENS